MKVVYIRIVNVQITSSLMGQGMGM